MKIRNILIGLGVIALALLLTPVTNLLAQTYNLSSAGFLFQATPGSGPQSGYAVPGYTGGAQATAGTIGEVIYVAVPSGSAVSLTSGSTANVATLPLTAGDWEVSAEIYIQGTVSTSFTILQGGVSATSATLPALTSTTPIALCTVAEAAVVPGSATVPQGLDPGTIQVNISTGTTASPTNYYLVANSTFSASTAGAYGWAKARRVR